MTLDLSAKRSPCRSQWNFNGRSEQNHAQRLRAVMCQTAGCNKAVFCRAAALPSSETVAILVCDGSTDHRHVVLFFGTLFLISFSCGQLICIICKPPVVSFWPDGNSHMSKSEQATLHNSRSAQKPSPSASPPVARL